MLIYHLNSYMMMHCLDIIKDWIMIYTVGKLKKMCFFSLESTLKSSVRRHLFSQQETFSLH